MRGPLPGVTRIASRVQELYRAGTKAALVRVVTATHPEATVTKCALPLDP
jgi:hypothetical protein